MKNIFFKVGLLNVGSLGTNHDDFIDLMERQPVDILAVNETWLRQGEEGRAPVLPGYNLRHVPRPLQVRGGRGGGVGFYVKRGVCARTWTATRDPRFDSVEQMWLTVGLYGKKIAVGTAYRPPWLNLELFLDAISLTLSTFGHCDHFILLGDFNVNILNTNEVNTKKMKNFLNCVGLTQLITSPTHFTENSQTLIDLVCTDLDARCIRIEPFKSINSHCYISCEFNIKKHKIKPQICTFRSLTNIDQENLRRDLEKIQWEYISAQKCVNDMVSVLNNYILMVFDVHAPLRSCVIRTNSYPWITDTVKIMMRLRDSALTRFRCPMTESSKQYSTNSPLSQRLYTMKR